MTATIIASIVGFVSAAILSIISHFLLLQKEKKIKLQILRSKLHDEQLLSYKKLWSHLEPTSKYCSDSTLIKYQQHDVYINKSVSKDFILSIRGFFFSDNGLFLSKSVRKELFGLLDILQKLSLSPVAGDNELVKIDKTQENKIRQKIIDLIKTMRTDVGLTDMEFPDHKV